jgi:hypothetical protein
MSDLSERFYTGVATLLESQRAELARYAGLLEAQRAALRSDDLELLAEMANQAAHLLEGLEKAGRHLTLARGPLAETVGPRSDSIRAMLAALAIELEQGFAAARQFSHLLLERRTRLVGVIVDENGAPGGRPGNKVRNIRTDSAFLDRSG